MDTQNTFEKKLEELKIFNLISVVSYSKINVPEAVYGSFIKRYPEKIFVKRLFGKKLVDNTDLPSEVMEAFKESEKENFSFNNVIYKKVVEDEEVYYDSYEDLTNYVKNILNMDEIARLLFLLEGSTGKLLRTRDVLALPGFKHLQNDEGEFYLEFTNDNLRGHNLRECKVTLNFMKNSETYNLDLGNMVYFVYERR